jgi:hypothetical protein
MKTKLTLVFPIIFAVAFAACNEAAHQAPVVVQDPLKDSVVLKSQNGYYNAATGSFINFYDVMQVVHSTLTDSGFYMIKLDTALAATNYHLDMHLTNIKTNNGKFDVKVNCTLNLAPPGDSVCMFIAQCKNGTAVTFDTVYAKKDDKDFTIHITNADAAFYYIVLWGLNRSHASTASFQDIMITAPK